MTPEDWTKVKELFHEAVDRPGPEREAFLDRFGADAAVLSEVRRLLRQQESSRDFLETPAAAMAPDLADGATGQEEPATIGPFRILGVLGEGGMGVVYRAEQDNPLRTVALKVIRPGLASESMLRRFEHEAQTLARLQHPGIAQVYQAGTEGKGSHRRPYFAMELVHGEPLPKHVESMGLGTREKLALFVRVCDAVQHAHMKGVIHRDLKPGNIVVDESGQPKILDFGIARLTDSDIRAATVQTDVGQIVGTVPYMSPEQVAGDPAELDTRSDVYSLGVVLYEVLTGRLPYDVERKSIVEAARLIREQAPARLSTTSRGLRGDLDVIAGRALEKDKKRRYQSAAELGSDITRYLNDEPIAARPPSVAYQFRKFATRHKAVVGAAGAIFLILCGGLVAVMWQRDIARFQASEASKQKVIAEREAKESDRQKGIAQNEAAEARKQRGIATRESSRLKAINTFYLDMLQAADPARTKGKEMTVKDMLDVAAAQLSATPTGDVEIDEEVRGTLGQTYWRIGALDKAEPLLREAAERAEPLLGPDHDLVLEAINVRGLVLTTLGRTKEAGPLIERVYLARLRVKGERDAATLSSMNNWARWLDNNGRSDEGLELIQQSAKVREETLGPDDRQTLTSIDNVGRVFYNRKRYDEALTWMMKANEGFRRNFGEDDPSTLSSYQNLAELMRARREYFDAERYAGLCADGRRRVLGMSDRFTLYAINLRGRILMDQKKAAKAEPLLRESVDGIRKVSGPGESFFAGWGSILARCLTALNRFDEAETLLRECESSAAGVSGDTTAIRKVVTEAFIELYAASNRPDEAAAWRAKLP